jgi:hypothetical protein
MAVSGAGELIQPITWSSLTPERYRERVTLDVGATGSLETHGTITNGLLAADWEMNGHLCLN